MESSKCSATQASSLHLQESQGNGQTGACQLETLQKAGSCSLSAHLKKKRSHIMNEEIETAMKRVQQALEAFEESKTAENARELEFRLTLLKLLLTP